MRSEKGLGSTCLRDIARHTSHRGDGVAIRKLTDRLTVMYEREKIVPHPFASLFQHALQLQSATSDFWIFGFLDLIPPVLINL